MLKNISIMEGVEVLKKDQQNSILGGKRSCNSNAQCGPRSCCNTSGWCQATGSHGSTGYLCNGDLI
ncbi:hypothetical protein [Kordia sp.]|uniref:hypothetical protein n=1 Tax=Kordia sp. TaxID=1965332 RepID=UPI003D2A0D0E